MLPPTYVLDNAKLVCYSALSYAPQFTLSLTNKARSAVKIARGLSGYQVMDISFLTIGGCETYLQVHRVAYIPYFASLPYPFQA
jgi:hypothetical protein